MTGCGPGLLVSVRSLAEARAAIGGGCAVLDLKEPSRGPLGMADPEVVGEAAGWGRSRGVATSMAMGEVADWSDEAVAEFTLPAVDFAKLGLHQRNNLLLNRNKLKVMIQIQLIIQVRLDLRNKLEP